MCLLAIFLIHGHFLPNSFCPAWAGHDRLSLEARVDHTDCRILFLPCSSFDWVINWVGGRISPSWCWDCGWGQWNIVTWELAIQWQLCGAELSGSALFPYFRRQVFEWEEGSAWLQLLFFPTNFTLFQFMVNHSSLIISYPRNRTKMTFEEDFNLCFF